MGPAGAGKSTIALRYAATAAERGDYAYFVTLDEGLPTLLERAEGLGIHVEPLLRSGRLQIEIINHAALSPGHFVSRVRAEVETNHASVIVIDSLNGLLAAMPGEEYLTIQLHELLAYLNNQGTTTILVMAQYGILGQGMVSPVDVSYLADTILLLRYFEATGEVRQAISVVKKRSGKHERTIRELQLGPDTVRVGRPLTQFQVCLPVCPLYVGQRGPLMQGAGDESSLSLARDTLILISAPVGRDAPLLDLFGRAKLQSQVCLTIEQLCQEIELGVGALFVTEEALQPHTTEPFRVLNKTHGRTFPWWYSP